MSGHQHEAENRALDDAGLDDTGLDDAGLARALAEAAGRVLLEVRASSLTGRELAKAGDRAAHEYLVDRLAELCPGDVVLSEEGADPAERLVADRVWIVDPLDG